MKWFIVVITACILVSGIVIAAKIPPPPPPPSLGGSSGSTVKGQIQSESQLLVQVAGSTNKNKEFFGIQLVEVLTDRVIVDFKHDFKKDLDLSKLTINIGSGWIVTDALPEGANLYISKTESNICVSDAASDEDFSSDCSDQSETIVSCPSEACSVEKQTFKFSDAKSLKVLSSALQAPPSPLEVGDESDSDNFETGNQENIEVKSSGSGGGGIYIERKVIEEPLIAPQPVQPVKQEEEKQRGATGQAVEFQKSEKNTLPAIFLYAMVLTITVGAVILGIAKIRMPTSVPRPPHPGMQGYVDRMQAAGHSRAAIHQQLVNAGHHPSTVQQQFEAPNKDMENYVMRMAAMGYTKQQIQAHMIKSGYAPIQIHKLFEKL